MFYFAIILFLFSCRLTRDPKSTWDCRTPANAPDNYEYLNCKDEKGRIRGMWAYFYPDSEKGLGYKVTHYRKGVKHGYYILFYRNGNYNERVRYRNGEMVGKWYNYMANGDPSFVRKLKRGKLNGKWKMYNHVNISGKRLLVLSSKGRYKNSKEYGVEKSYDLYTGNIDMKLYYKDGKIIRKEYYDPKTKKLIKVQEY